ncbi:MAG: hypothetical protein ACK5SX_15130 [Sandaracinobacter sp.]
MMPSTEILAVLCLGLASWAIGASLAAWKWRGSYRGALAAYRSFRDLKIARPTKSEAHVKAARTRIQRERERKLAKMRELQAETHARELGW